MKAKILKKTVTAIFAAAALLLSGCGKNAAADRFAPFSEALCGRADLSFTADVRAEYSDRSALFMLEYADEGEGCRVMVLAPEGIRGVTAHLNGAEAALGYDSILLDAGSLDRYGLSPTTALPRLVEALRQGHLETAWAEDGLTVWELRPDDTLSIQVWLDENLTPKRAELISEGRVAVYCEITNWK